jgi:hypothetical protein
VTPNEDGSRMPPDAIEASPRAALVLGVRLGFIEASRRLGRRALALTGLLALALTAIGALIERSATIAGAADRALMGCMGLVVPLLTFAIVARVIGRRRLGEATWPLARFGLSRRAIAFGMHASAALASAVIAALGAALAVLASSGLALGDAAISAWIGALGALAYAGWFTLGASFLRRGAGRFVPLVLDFILGGSQTLIGALFPRGHLTHLIGGPPPIELAPSSSSMGLVAMAVALALGAALRQKQ